MCKMLTSFAVLFFCSCLLRILNLTWQEVGILRSNPDNKTFFFAFIMSFNPLYLLVFLFIKRK